MVVGLSPLRTFVQRLIDRIFYRAPADYRRVLNTLSRDLVITPNLERTLDLLAEQLQHSLAPERFVSRGGLKLEHALVSETNLRLTPFRPDPGGDRAAVENRPSACA